MNTNKERQAHREKKQRNREIALALLLILLVFLGTWGQTSYFGSESWYFLALLNLNAILMVVVFYLAARNIIKLIAERRRKVFGYRLRTRLLLAFVSLSLIPVVLMFLAANRVIITSIDYWFTSTVANSMDAALEVGQSVYTASEQRLSERIVFIDEELSRITQEQDEEEKKQTIKYYLDAQKNLLTGNALALIELRNYQPHLNFATPNARETSILMQRVVSTTPWASLYTEVYSHLISLETADYTIAIYPLSTLPSFFLVLTESIGSASQSKLNSISRGFEEYTYLKSFRKPLRLSFSLILALLGLIMIFSSIFMALRLSKELTAPIEELAKGSDRIAQGELDIILEDKGKDELGQLVSSFNSMVQQVRNSNESIQHANTILEHRNILIETVLENIATGVFVLNTAGTLLTINKAASSMLHINVNRWRNRIPSQYLNPREKELFHEMILFLEKNPAKAWRKEIELVIRKKNLKLLLHALILPDFYSEQKTEEGRGIIIAVMEDITELAYAERLAAWREVAKRVTHEIKNPLTPIRLSAERLERKFNSEKKEVVFTECTNLIIREVERIQLMIKNFTEFARMPEVQLKQEDIVSLVKETLLVFKTSHTHIDWQFYSSKETIPLLLHAETFKQALINIYLNAGEALVEKAPSVKRPTVITKLEYQEEKGEKKYCKLTIADNAIQLSHDSLNRLFEPYYTKKKDGTGLGLAIVKSIFSEHNASIFAENNEQGGTSICILFPLTQERNEV